MTDEQTGAAADQAEATSNGGETKSGDDIKPPKTYGRRAYNNLRAARRSLEAADWQSDEYSRHLVATDFSLLDDRRDPRRQGRCGSARYTRSEVPDQITR